MIVADRTFEKAAKLAETLGKLALPLEVADAYQEADIIILAVWFNTIKDLLKNEAAAFENKIIVDPSNPIALGEHGGFKKIIGAEESAGEILAELAPAGAKFVKAFGTLGAASLTSAAFAEPEKAVLFYATDHESVNGEIEQLILDSGFEAARIGGIDQSIRIEVFGDLHEFGGAWKNGDLS